MKIIEKGIVKLPQIFVCYECNCKFEASPDEYNVSRYRNGKINSTVCSAICPCCKHKCSYREVHKTNSLTL